VLNLSLPIPPLIAADKITDKLSMYQASFRVLGVHY